MSCFRFFLAVCVVLGLVLGPSAATAEPAEPASGRAGCELSATLVLPADTKLMSASKGGAAVASFTGVGVPLRVSGLAGDPRKARVQVVTSDGQGGVRLQGWIPFAVLDLFAARDLPVAGQHVWITASQKVRVLHGGPKELTIDYAIPGARGQRVQTKVACDAVSLLPPKVGATSIPDRARKFQMGHNTLKLYDGPAGRVVFTFDMEEDARQVFWSREARRGFVHLVSRGGVTIDGWARRRDLVPLKRSEHIMQDVPRTWPRQGRSLSMRDAPALITARQDVTIRSRPAADAPAIGVVERGAKVYPMERSAGWVNVYPESLAVMPPDSGGFWVRSEDLS